jgi:hypothetical protein
MIHDMSKPDQSQSNPAHPDDSRRARAAARGNWPIRQYRLGQEPNEDLAGTTTAGERMAMVWRLSLDAWVMSGSPLPKYRRDQMPGRVIRPGDVRGDD